MKIRRPHVAGTFYPATEQSLIQTLASIKEEERPHFYQLPENDQIIGAVVPHAGYVYSGKHAMHFFQLLRKCKEQFDTVIIVNPNHTGYGAAISKDDSDYWETPLGSVAIDSELNKLLPFDVAPEAQLYEHSAEVMLPFLQYCLPYDFKIVPLCMFAQNTENARAIAKAVHETATKLGRKVLFLASSDFSHQVPPGYGRQMDDKVVARILNFDTEGVFSEVKMHQISVCGYGPIMSLMEFAKLQHTKPAAKVLKQGHSGEAHPSQSVVDYISILMNGSRV